MRIRWMTFLLLTGLAASAHADDNAVKQTLQANYNKISVAFRLQDPSVMESMLAPGATLTTPDHKTWNRSRIISDFKKQSSIMLFPVWRRTITALTVHGNTAVATVRGKFHATFGG
ncbi:MAG TPA: nuclear transport factor 2 family protein, partial [Chthonomonadales bacterium]|nr:nuclear transport factor 2 family protein [Chthonomonadales bacterium]